MNTCVSDNKVIINIQGIRYVQWGETTSYSVNSGKFYVTVNYKGNHQTFYYQTSTDAYILFTKIREAIDKSAKEVK